MSAATSHSAPLRVLVVEPNYDLGLLMGDVLRGAGEHEIAFAKSAREGIAYLRRGTYDVILAGARLAGTTGLEMIDQAKAEGLLAESAVVIVASGDHSLRREVHARGATFLPKPLWPEQLLAAVRRDREPRESGVSISATRRGR